MTVEEIFSNLSTHMAKGLLIHNQMASLYSFLNLRGYRRCHEYHYYEESHNYRRLQNLFLKFNNKLIRENKVEEVEIIPSNWYKFLKTEVDSNNKRSAVKELMKKWIDWEKETKVLLETYYKSLYELNEVNLALEISYFIKDVSNELAGAYEEQINLESVNYDIVYMEEKQMDLYKQYNKKIKKIHEDDEE